MPLFFCLKFTIWKIIFDGAFHFPTFVSNEMSKKARRNASHLSESANYCEKSSDELICMPDEMVRARNQERRASEAEIRASLAALIGSKVRRESNNDHYARG